MKNSVRYDEAMYGIILLFAIAVNFSTAITSIAVGLGAAIILFRGVKFGDWPRPDRGILCVMGLYFLIQIVIAALSLEPRISFREVLGEVHRCFPLFFAMLFIKNRTHIKWILIAFMFAIIANNLYGLYQYFVLGLPRAYAFSHTPTFYGSFLLMQMPILLYMATLEFMPMWSRRAAVATGLFCMLMLFLSGTRGAWLAFVGVCLALVFFDKRFYKLGIKILGMMAVVALVCFFAVPSVHERAGTLVDPQYQSNSERILMWKSAAMIVEDYPIHGIGQNMFVWEYNMKYILPEAKERADEPGRGHTHPHNNLWKVASEGGILGLAAFLILHGYFFRRFYLLHKRERGYMMISCGMTAFLIALGLQLEGMTDTNMNQVPIMREYWLLVGMLLVSGKIVGCPARDSKGAN